MTGDPSALGIGAASFWSRSVSGGDKRYSGKPDGGAVSGAGTPREKTTVNGQQTTDFGSISLKK